MTIALVSLALLASTSLAAPSEARTWRFRVSLGEREIGTHVFQVAREADGRRVTSEARFAVRFWFIDAYRYSHTATERWTGDCLTEIDARTDDNGRRRAVNGRREGSAFVVEAGDRAVRHADAGCLMSFAYWHPGMLSQSRLLNAQTGELQSVRVDTLGVDTIPVRGAGVAAERYAIVSGTFRIDVWYAGRAREWVRLETQVGKPGADGRRLTYSID